MRTWVLLTLVCCALLLLVAPREWVLQGISSLQFGVVPQQVEPAAHKAFLAAYPEEVFGSRERLRAPVLVSSTAPYRGLLTIGAGSNDGVRVGMVAVLPDGAPGGSFVGRVTAVSSGTSEVVTVFDTTWKSAVRVGASSTDALFEGGLTPTLTRLPRGSALGAGDTILSVDDTLPYGLFMGRVREVRDTSDGVLSEALVSLPYTLRDLQFVELIAQ